jgi:Zn-dependent M28 family amino/carboxypeptidase
VHFGPSAGEVVVVGAHYDAHAGTPGADDNASGVAWLIELAGLLGRNPPSGPVDLVAYTLEEPPHFKSGSMGGVQHVRSFRKAGQAVRLMLALEMIGFFSDDAGSQHYPHPSLAWLYPDTGITLRWSDGRSICWLRAA